MNRNIKAKNTRKSDIMAEKEIYRLPFCNDIYII